jgi:two-component system, OmpR family, sensor kinase
MTAERLVPMRLHPQASDNEIGRLVAALNRMTARLGTAFAAQRRFTADASHEMRTPLTILQGEFELALTRERSASEYRRILQSGLEETRRLARIVESLAFLARGDAESAVRRPFQPVSLSALVREISQALNRPLQDKDLCLALKSEGEAAVNGDPEALHRAALNLLDNAIRYSLPGGQITVTTETLADECRLIVADTGIGISPEDLPQVFDRFFRADKARVNDGGSGLGLSIAQSIIVAHGGRIMVESKPGAGSRFVVLLPHIKHIKED